MDLSTANVATWLTLFVAAIGGVITVVHPETLSFADYLNDVKFLIPGLAIGRGLAAAGRSS